MKSVPLTMRGPTDDSPYTWVKSHPQLYERKGLQYLLCEPPISRSHEIDNRGRASRLTTRVSSSSRTLEGRGNTVLPKIATGRSAHSAKKLWRDHENIKISTVIQNELETPKIPPLYVPKNPKPLYKRPVDEMKPFKVLHQREFREELTDCEEVQGLYSQITFLRNAVRNTDGRTSYQNLCKRPRSRTSPSPDSSEPGLIKGNKLHWRSASVTLHHPRMLLPLKPGPSTEWYAWKVKELNTDGKRIKTRNYRETPPEDFLTTFSPRPDPRPTPVAAPQDLVAKLSHPEVAPDEDAESVSSLGSILAYRKLKSKASKDVSKNSQEVTFMTESKEEATVPAGAEPKDDSGIAHQDVEEHQTSQTVKDTMEDVARDATAEGSGAGVVDTVDGQNTHGQDSHPISADKSEQTEERPKATDQIEEQTIETKAETNENTDMEQPPTTGGYSGEIKNSEDAAGDVDNDTGGQQHEGDERLEEEGHPDAKEDQNESEPVKDSLVSEDQGATGETTAVEEHERGQVTTDGDDNDADQSTNTGEEGSSKILQPPQAISGETTTDENEQQVVDDDDAENNIPEETHDSEVTNRELEEVQDVSDRPDSTGGDANAEELS